MTARLCLASSAWSQRPTSSGTSDLEIVITSTPLEATLMFHASAAASRNAATAPARSSSAERAAGFVCAGGWFRVGLAASLLEMPWTLALPAPGFAFEGDMSGPPTRLLRSDAEFNHVAP